METKFENFKQFVQEISPNSEVLDQYRNMSWFKLQTIGYVLLVPNRDNLDQIVDAMRDKLRFDEQHLPKFRRYIELFVEYLAGEQPRKTPPDYITSKEMSFEERIMAYEQAHKKL